METEETRRKVARRHLIAFAAIMSAAALWGIIALISWIAAHA